MKLLNFRDSSSGHVYNLYVSTDEDHSGPNRPNRNRTVPEVRTEVRTVRPGVPLWEKVDILSGELYFEFFIRF